MIESGTDIELKNVSESASSQKRLSFIEIADVRSKFASRCANSIVDKYFCGYLSNHDKSERHRQRGHPVADVASGPAVLLSSAWSAQVSLNSV
jgi:hypothetical protein